MIQEKKHTITIITHRANIYHENSEQTWKQIGGGRSFIKTTAAGGTGNTPPGTGCKPGAVKERKVGIKWDGRVSAHVMNQHK